MKKYKFPKGGEHINCENGIICNKCAWIMSKNSQIDAFEFCLEKIQSAKTMGECAHESREKCAEKHLSCCEGHEHAEWQRYILKHNKDLDDLEKEITNRLNLV